MPCAHRQELREPTLPSSSVPLLASDLAGQKLWKAGQTTPLEIASRFPLFAQLQQQLDDPDHFLENPTATVASLRPLIGFIPEQ